MKENKKSLSYYQSLDYDVIIEKDRYEDEEWYIAYCDELGRGSCYGTGDTPQEALEMFLKDKNAFIEELYRAKRPIPEPRPREDQETVLSGIFNVRTTPQLHGLLSGQAKKSGVSLNHYVNQLLAMGAMVGEIKQYFDGKCNALEDKIDAHHYQMTTQMIDYQKHTVETRKPDWDLSAKYEKDFMKIAS